MRARLIEQNQFDEQQALLLLSGLSLTRRRALPSGTFLIRAQIACLAAVFLGCCVGASTRVQRAVWFCVAAYRGPKGFILSCSRFVGLSPTEAKQKIQGFTPTDKQPAVCLSCARGENMKKIALILLLAIIPRLQSPLFAQDPSANVPDDSSTAMTTEQGDPIGNTDAPNNENVPADPNYSPPEGPFAPELPDTANYEGPVGVTGIFNGNVATAGLSTL